MATYYARAFIHYGSRVKTHLKLCIQIRNGTYISPLNECLRLINRQLAGLFLRLRTLPVRVTRMLVFYLMM